MEREKCVCVCEIIKFSTPSKKESFVASTYSENVIFWNDSTKGEGESRIGATLLLVRINKVLMNTRVDDRQYGIHL